MSWKDLENARAERAAKEAEKEAKSEARKAKKARKEFKAISTAEEATVSKGKRGPKRKSNAAADTAEPKAKSALMSQIEAKDDEIAEQPWLGPVTRMW